MEMEAELFVGDIKQEQERQYVVIIPESLEKRYQLRKLNINIRKFDGKLRVKARMFETFLSCEKCDFVTRESGHLTKHLPLCGANTDPTKNKRIYACAFCELEFSRYNSRSKHVSEHRCGSNWQCSNCTCNFPKKTQLRNHYSTCVKKFLCATCEDKYTSPYSLKDHQMFHRHGIYATKPIIRINCDMCDSWFRTEKSLYEHKRYVHNRIHCQCDICGKTFSNKSLIRKHMQFHFKVPCPICQHLLAQHRLKEHIEQHSSTVQYECKVCDKNFRNRSDLSSHKNSIHKVQEVQCDCCNKTFRNKSFLRRHFRNHQKVACSVCRRPVAKFGIKIHMKRFHSSGKSRLACNIPRCPHKFSNARELKKHQEIHIGQGRYKCPKCNFERNKMQRIKIHLNSKVHQT